MMKLTRTFVIRFSVEIIILLVALLAVGTARLNPPEPEIVTVTTTPTQAPHQPAERIVYVQQGSNATSDLWVVDLRDPDAPQQLTFNEQGKSIYHYEATADGQYIVYSTFNLNSPIYDNLTRLNVATGEQVPVTDCAYQSVWCQNFALSASGEYMMYHYRWGDIFNEMRVVALRTTPFTERTVYRYGMTETNYPVPTTVSNSNTFAFEVASANYNLQLYDADTNMLGEMLPVGAPNRHILFSDDGSRYIHMTREGDPEGRFTKVRQATYPYNQLSTAMYWDNEPSVMGVGFYDWYPDNQHLLIAEPHSRSCPENTPFSYRLKQFMTYNVTANALNTLPIHGNDRTDASWNNDGSKIVLNALIDACNSNAYELTIYDMQTGMKTTLPIDARNPQWLGT